MSLIDLLTDPYDRKARLYPALVLLLPIAATAMVFLAVELGLSEALIFLAVSCGGAFLLSQLARDAGKRKEPGLWKSWGGPPTDVMLSHADTRLDAVTKKRYHTKLAQLVDGTQAPTTTQEQADVAGALTIYSAWAKYLRTQTRDTKKFHLLFKENINYGYRRNVWGMRPIGIVSTLLCCAGIGAYSWYQCRTGCVVHKPMLICFTIDFVFLLLWLFVFTRKWVRIPAQAYSDRLLESIEVL